MKISTRCIWMPLAALLAAGCSETSAPVDSRADRAVNVIVEPLAFERARTRVEAVGTSRARLSAEIYPASAGEVVAIDFEPGQFVRKGDLLVELDRREEELAVQLAEIRLEDAERLYERYRRSAESGAVIQTVLDEARTAAETARVELQRARIALADRTIKAVFDGHVGATEADPGDRVSTNTLVTTLDDRSSLLVSFDIPEMFIGELAVGDRVRLETWSGNIPEVMGAIVDIGSRIDPRNRTFAARAEVINESDLLRPGMSFRVRVEMQGELFAVINETALQWGADGAYVWSVVDGNAVRTPVEIIERREGRILVEGSLLRGDIIVVEGTQQMRDGVAVSYDRARFATEGSVLPTNVTAGVSAAAAWD